MPAHSPSTQRFFASVLAIALAFAGLFLTTSPATAAPGDKQENIPAAAVQLSKGSLNWGVKASWRQYAGPAALAGGSAQPTPGGNFTFPLTSGSFDATSGTTIVNFSGSLHWKSHYYPDEKNLISPPPGYNGPLDIHVLDVTFANPSVTIGADGATLSMEVVSRNINTWQMVDFGRVPLVQLDVSEKKPVLDSGNTSWSEIQTAWTQQGVDAVGYTVGQIVDPVGFSYAGPGGAPVVSESWTLPGSPKLVMAENGLIDGRDLSTLWADPSSGIYHTVANDDTTQTKIYRAYDLAKRSFIGSSLTLSWAESSQIGSLAMADPAAGRLYFRSSTAPGANIDSALQWDAARQTYSVLKGLSIPIPSGQFLWSGARGEAFQLAGKLPPGDKDQNNRQRTLTKWVINANGAATATEYALPKALVGSDRGGTWYRLAGGVVLSDGSLLLPRAKLNPLPGGSVPEKVLAQRITLPAPGTAVVEEIAGTDVGTQNNTGYNGAFAAGNSVYLTRAASRTGTALAQNLNSSGNGQLYVSNPVADLAKASVFAIDPENATLWAQDGNAQTLSAVRNGGVLTTLSSPYLSQNPFPPLVAADHSVYAATFDGRQQGIENDGKGLFGFASFSLASSPRISMQPVPLTLNVPTGSQTVQATFRVEASASPAPSVQWQAKARGVLAFKDIPGATAAELNISARQLDDGVQYRAVFTNPAGAIATKPAALSVTTEKAPEPQLPIDPTATSRPGSTVAGFLTWGVKDSFRSYISGSIARGWIATSNGASGRENFTFAQTGTSTWNVASGTGSTGYQGSVQFWGHGGILNLTFSNPQLSIDSATAGTLFVSANGSGPVAIAAVNLEAAAKTELDGGVSYANAPVTLSATGARMFSYGSSQFYQPGQVMDPVTFTVGSPPAPGTAIGPDGTKAGTGKTTVAAFSNKDWKPPAEAPVKEGITLQGADPLKLQAGSTITATASGFQPNEKYIKAVIYSEPRVLADDLVADGQGNVSWTGALPADLTGEHTLTFQGSVNRGVTLKIGEQDLAGQCKVDGANLSWGFKESFRSYIQSTIANGNWTTANGASYQTPNFAWSQGSGAINPSTKAGLVKFTGSVNFTGHDGVLNTTVANPQIQLVDDRTAFLLLDVSGATMDGAMIDNKASSFVKLDLGAVSTSFDGGTMKVTAAPSALTPAGHIAFPNYESGAAFDPVSFSFPVPADCGKPTEAKTPVVAPPVNSLDGGSAAQPGDLWWLLWAIPVAIIAAALVLLLVLFLRRRLSVSTR